MTKVNVLQTDGIIELTPGDTRPKRTYDVKNNLVDVEDEDLVEFLRNVDGSVALTSPEAAQKVADDNVARAKADADAAKAKAANDKAVADATAAGAARAAAETKAK
jgi:hypothetical protein